MSTSELLACGTENQKLKNIFVTSGNPVNE